MTLCPAISAVAGRICASAKRSSAPRNPTHREADHVPRANRFPSDRFRRIAIDAWFLPTHLPKGWRGCGRRPDAQSLKLYFHPLSSFCQKALIAFYENDTPFEPHIVDLFDETSSADFRKIWPIGKIPVLRDDAMDRTVPESSIIIEYLAQHYPGRTQLVPADPELGRQTRLRDRFYDLYVNVPMQKVVTDRLRPAGKNDPHGVEGAKTLLQTAIGMVDRDMAAKTWAMGDAFTMVDCAAAPPLFYASKVLPFGDTHKNAAAYLDRLTERPSLARALEEAQPYFALFPK